MIRLILICALAFLPEALFSQSAPTQPPPERKRITKVIRIHYGDAGRIAGILRNIAQVNAESDNILNAVIINGIPPNVESAEQTIKELDASPVATTSGDIELIVHVIGGSNEPLSTPADANPSTMGPVVKQLRAIFPFKNYGVLSTVLMRSQQGKSAESSGLIKYPFGDSSSPYPDHYKIAYETASVSAASARTIIHLQNFRFQGKVTVVMHGSGNTSQIQSFDVGVGSDVDLRPGQQVVVGNTNVASGDSALFIVISAKLVD